MRACLLLFAIVTLCLKKERGNNLIEDQGFVGPCWFQRTGAAGKLLLDIMKFMYQVVTVTLW